eukprot:7079552-Heterocapsa_arctica.AAC.1
MSGDVLVCWSSRPFTHRTLSWGKAPECNFLSRIIGRASLELHNPGRSKSGRSIHTAFPLNATWGGRTLEDSDGV